MFSRVIFIALCLSSPPLLHNIMDNLFIRSAGLSPCLSGSDAGWPCCPESLPPAAEETHWCQFQESLQGAFLCWGPAWVVLPNGPYMNLVIAPPLETHLSRSPRALCWPLVELACSFSASALGPLGCLGRPLWSAFGAAELVILRLWPAAQIFPYGKVPRGTERLLREQLSDGPLLPLTLSLLVLRPVTRGEAQVGCLELGAFLPGPLSAPPHAVDWCPRERPGQGHYRSTGAVGRPRKGVKFTSTTIPSWHQPSGPRRN